MTVRLAWPAGIGLCVWFTRYDGRNVPISEKKGATMGMSMTEKQGGSDVRSNTTVAKPVNPGQTGNGKAYLLKGHK